MTRAIDFWQKCIQTGHSEQKELEHHWAYNYFFNVSQSYGFMTFIG